MKGTMLVINPEGAITRTDTDDPDILERSQKAVGGWIEKVPGFNSILYDREVRKCVALCNEEGKLDELPRNTVANRYWTEALKRDFGLHGLTSPDPDFLVGSIVIVFGDEEFMEAL